MSGYENHQHDSKNQDDPQHVKPKPNNSPKIIMRRELMGDAAAVEALPSFDVTYGGEGAKLSKFTKNPLVPLGAITTAGILVAGLLSFRSGNTQLSQQLMRARVLAQGATLGVLSLSVVRMQKIANDEKKLNDSGDDEKQK